MNKRVILLSGLVSLLSITGCGGNGNSNNNNKNSNSGNNKVTIENPWWTTEGSLDFDENDKVDLNGVEISLETVVAGEDETAFRDIVEDFNEENEYGIRVTVGSTNQSEYESSVAKRIANEANAPDLLMSHQKAHKWFADNKYVQPFNEAIQESGIEFSISNYMTGLGDLSDLGYEGNQFQIPIDAQSMVILYNKDMLSKLGYDNAPTSNAELMDVCAAFRAKYGGDDYRAISLPMGESFYNDYVFNTALVQNGVELYNTSDYYVNWTSANNTAGFTNARKAINNLFTNKYLNAWEDGTTGQTRFFNNKALFLFCLPWNINSILAGYASNNNINIQSAKDNFIGGCSMANLFDTTGTSATSEAIFGDSHSFLMSKTVTDIKEKVACLVFAKWFTENATAGAEWAEAGHISASHTIVNSDEYNGNAFVNNYINEFYLDLNQFETIGNNPYYSDLIRVLRIASTELTNTTSDINKILQDAEKEVNDLIDETNLFG